MVVSDSLGFQHGNVSKLRWVEPNPELFGVGANLRLPTIDELLQRIMKSLEEKSLYLIAIGSLMSYAGHVSDSPIKMALMLGGGTMVLIGIAPYAYGVVKDL